MYIAHLFQPHGCDYTIACGHKLVVLQATDLDAAIAELRNLVTTDYRGDTALESATLLRVAQQIAMPVAEWYEQAERQKTAHAQSEQEQQERELYEKLKHRFG